MGNGAISKDTFNGMAIESKLGVLFDFAQESHRCACATEEKVDGLERKFDQKKRFDTSAATLAGLIGGALAALGIKWGPFA